MSIRGTARVVALVGIALCVAAALAAGAAIATAPSPINPLQEMAFTLEGKITEHSPGKLTVSTEENIVFHVTYGDKTSIKLKDGSQGSAKDLRTGVRIKVDGDLAESGEIGAKTIEIEADSSSKGH